MSNPQPEEVLKWSEDEFKKLVDDDLRRRSPNSRERSDLSESMADLLRHPVIVDRWYSTLIRMAKSVDGQLAAREAEYESKRSALKAKVVETEASMARMRRDGEDTTQLEARTASRKAALENNRSEYLKQKAGTLRFKSGLDENVIEARGIRDRLRHRLYESIVAEERNYYAERYSRLEAAVRDHRATMEKEDMEPTEADEKLWQVLEPEATDA